MSYGSMLIQKTSFLYSFGNFQFEVIPFDLTDAPSNFQRMIDHVLNGFPFVSVYLFDVIIFSKTVEDHIEHLKITIDLIITHRRKMKTCKLYLSKELMALLGNIFGVVVI